VKLKEIADLIGGVVKGDELMEITGARGLESAGEGHITYLAKARYVEKLHQCKASAVIVEKEIATDKAQIIARNPTLGFARALHKFYPDTRLAPRIDPKAVVGENVKLGKNVTLSAFVALADNVSIGDDTVLYPGVVVGEGSCIGRNCTIFPNVVIYHESIIGNHVTLHAGVVIGSDGFGYVPDENGCHFKIKQVGSVVIEDHVEIGANSCIDRASMGVTLIKKGTKIDNMVQVAHNCIVGEHSIIVAQAGIAGSCNFGHHVVIGGQVGIADHINLGDHVSLLSQSGVFRDIESDSVYGGSPAVPQKDYARQVSLTQKLPDLAKKIKELESRLDEIEKK
jgi:UDP-3-O-[3-hydroxymyristoyl] glucosamine N-acyltransferase